MRIDAIPKQIYSSFLSCNKDEQILLKKLFIQSKPYSDILKRLLVINNPDCIDDINWKLTKYWTNEDYQKAINALQLSDLIKRGYIRTNPKIVRKEFEDIKSYILLTFDNFSTNRGNPLFRDCTVHFDIICYDDQWDLTNYRERPLVIAGYIDGILNSLTDEYRKASNASLGKVKLSGIGEYTFAGCQLNVLNEDISMYSLTYYATHFTEDSDKITNLWQ